MFFLSIPCVNHISNYIAVIVCGIDTTPMNDFQFMGVNHMSSNKSLPTGYPDAKRSKFRLNIGWRFHLGDVAQAWKPDYDDTAC